jgi:murein DD-endopeptidase MepM/ murein hydrolase activator NlpD
MRLIALILWVPVLLLGGLVFLPHSSIQAAPEPPLPIPTPESEASTQVRLAILNAINKQQEFVLAFLVNDVQVQQVDLSESGDWAIGWLTMADAQTGDPVPSEPGLAIARRRPSGWDVFLPTDPLWLDLLIALPEDLIDTQLKQVYVEMNADYGPVPYAVYSGYRLPWAAGQTAWLSGSTSHDSYIPSGNAHYAFDFYIPQTMYRLYASKSGVVWRAKWDTPNGDASGTGNYIVLQDNSTSPVTYQLYLHMAQESIPPALRERGAYVVQGQYIGMADDTGQSTGHHLHFQVHTNPDSYWGRAVDVTFEDVGINGGRPRVKNSYYNDQKYCWPSDACSSFQSSYVSGNVVRGDVTPPTGDLFEPYTGTTVYDRKVHVEGWASDIGSGLEKAQLIGYYQNSWHEVGPQFSSITFSLDWDMCADQVPDGPVSLALRIWDKEANPAIGLPGLRHFTKDYACDSPRDGKRPDASFSNPKSGDFFNSTGKIELEITINDPAIEIDKVQFLYHSGNWLNSPWQVLGSDTDGQDGWTYSFDTGPLLEQKDIAFYANIYDVQGNWTGTGAWDVGIDRTAPLTNLDPLSDQQTSNAVLLRWTASDNLAGLDYFNLQWQIASGAWNKYDADPPGSSSKLWFIGNPGSNIGFRLRGVDKADNAENYPLSSESRTNIPSVEALCSSPDTWDAGNNDNTAGSATLVEVNSPSASHNFCNPLTGARDNDEDWIKFSVQPGHTYMLRAIPTADMVAVVIDLYAPDGITLIRHAEPARFGSSTQIQWNSDQTATVYLRARHQDGRVIGSKVAYQLSVQELIPIFLPIVNR